MTTLMRRLMVRPTHSRNESGMTTAEYAVGTLAACAFAVILLAVVKSPAVRDGLAKVITTALGMSG